MGQGRLARLGIIKEKALFKESVSFSLRGEPEQLGDKLNSEKP